MKQICLLLVCACFALAACREASKEQPASASPAAKKSYSPDLPPTHKEVLRGLLQMQDLGVAGIPSCAGAGTEPTDKNIGDYISGFLAEQDSSKGGNWIEVSTKAERGPDQQREWRSEVVIRHLDGDDRWGWGVSFLMRPADHSVVTESITCTGAG